MANIQIEQLNSVTYELTPNESNIIVGGNLAESLSAISVIAGGAANVLKGLQYFQKPGATSGTTSVNGADPFLTLAFQKYLAPNPFV